MLAVGFHLAVSAQVDATLTDDTLAEPTVGPAPSLPVEMRQGVLLELKKGDDAGKI